MRTILVLSLLATSAAALDKWTVDDLLRVKQIGDVAISPDGRYVLYSLSWAIPDENRRPSELFAVTADARSTVRLAGDEVKATSPRWIPSTHRVSYLSGNQVWSVEATGGAPAQVTHAERGVRSYTWSPDGKRLLYISPEPKSREQVAHEKQWGVVISFEEQWPERSSLWLLEGGQSKRITDGTSNPGSPEFSPDGRAVAFLDGKGLKEWAVGGGQWAVKTVAEGVNFFAWAPEGGRIAYIVGKEDPQPYGNQFRRLEFLGTGSVWVADVAARRVTQQEYPGLSRLVWSRDGKKMAFMARAPGTKDVRAIWNMYIVSVMGEVRGVAQGFDFYRGGMGMTWAKGDGEVWFLNGERMGYNVFAVDAASGKLRHVTTGQDCLSQVSYSDDLSRAALVRENVNTKPDIHVAALPEWRESKITDINADVRRFTHGQGEIIRYPSEGQEIEALLIKPVDFDRAKKYPLILIVHGGPTWYKKNDWHPEWEEHPIEAYAAQGYCLVFPNVRGSADYGAEFRRANFRDLGGGDFRDEMAAVDYLIGQGFVDANRLGVAGWSYGGYLTPAIITKTDRFKAAQFGAGIPSLEAMYSRLSTVEWIVHDNYGPRPWEDARMQIQDSPLYSAWKVKTPTLIEHGEDDPRCPVGGDILFYKALKSYGVPVVLEIYPKESHGIEGPLLRRRCLQRNLEWFNKWLKGDRSTSFERLFPQ